MAAAPEAKVPVQVPIQQTIVPPEVINAQPLTVTRNLAKERQQREAKLAQDLAKVSVPAHQPAARPSAQMTEINVPSTANLPIDRIVAKSVGSGISTAAAPARPVPARPAPAQSASASTAIAARPAQPAPAPNTAVLSTASSTASSVAGANSQSIATSINTLSNPAAPSSTSSTTPSTTPSHNTVPANIAPNNTPAAPSNTTAANVAPNPTTAKAAPNVAPSNLSAQAAAAAPAQPQAERNHSPNPTSGNPTSPAPAATIQTPSATETAPIARLEPRPQPAQQISRALDAAISQEAATQLVAQAPLQNQPITDIPAVIAASRPASPPPQPAAPVAITQTNRSPVQLASSQATGVPPAAPATSPGVPTGVPTASVSETYTLGPGDRIALRFFNTPEYNGEAQVQSDGTLNLPLVGSFSVAGMTVAQAEAEISARYQSELRYAIVTVSLVQARPLQVAIVGEVQQPGSYTLSLVEGAQFPGIVRAIQTAGGTTQAADLRNVQVQRASGPNGSQSISVNLVDLLQGGNLGQDLKLRDGDRIVIPTAATVDFSEATQFAASNFAATPSQPFDVAIVGEVFRPGAYKMGSEGRATVTQAIQLAGGVKPTANIRQIQIRRPTRSGTEQVINIDFWQLLQSGNLYQDLMLQQGDRIVIPTATALSPEETVLLTAANVSPEAIKVNVVGEVKSPGVVSVAPSSTLNQAILAAGGLNNRATRELELIRLEPNGTLTRRTIHMDILQGYNTTENPLLQNNDIVVVGRSGLAQFSDQFNQINSILGPLLQLIPFRPF
ncbi:hypothetical protein HJG54_30835 [Leptolyngbya sp. NK1-12]|uniref:Polysaccharide export protein n=1 Tax=Leptolyngbya sp. NK1-12 TaxID=2547451 RepID=A0AA97ANY5_9CYAN|nr:hypothetical protein HJG54_30835 [Leptolyngbya sp. NK1-12]